MTRSSIFESTLQASLPTVAASCDLLLLLAQGFWSSPIGSYFGLLDGGGVGVTEAAGGAVVWGVHVQSTCAVCMCPAGVLVCVAVSSQVSLRAVRGR